MQMARQRRVRGSGVSEQGVPLFGGLSRGGGTGKSAAPPTFHNSGKTSSHMSQNAEPSRAALLNMNTAIMSGKFFPGEKDSSGLTVFSKWEQQVRWRNNLKALHDLHKKFKKCVAQDSAQRSSRERPTTERTDPPPTVLNSNVAIFGAGVRSCTEKRLSVGQPLLPSRPLFATNVP